MPPASPQTALDDQFHSLVFTVDFLSGNSQYFTGMLIQNYSLLVFNTPIALSSTTSLISFPRNVCPFLMLYKQHTKHRMACSCGVYFLSSQQESHR